jgi:MFS family permease
MLKQYFEPGSLFANRSYRNLWLSTVLTIVAMTAFPIALAISVLDAGGSATVLGLILGVRIVAGVLFAPVGGVWADRLPRKTVLIAADGFRAVISSIVIFAEPESISFWVLGGIIFLMGLQLKAEPLQGQVLQAY